jgi:nitroimidazol reductase NimA-like FMN-containing flavoprotein (pyridoxamine 5'-phosphate oxidase superfamily)
MRRKEREITEKELIEEIINKADVCRIALANDNIPYIVTMNFGHISGTEPKLYFHCASEGRKLEMISRNNFVCFEMDTDHEVFKGLKGCDWGMKFRSVIGTGSISIVTEKKEKKAGLDSIMKHYGGNGEFTYDEKVFGRTTVLRLEIKEMTGKKR